MMRRFGLAGLLVALGLCLAPATRAQDDGHKKAHDVDVFFQKLDTNADGKLSKAEFLKLADRFKDRDKAVKRLTATYDKIDPDDVGISKTQFRRFLEIRKK